MTDLEHLFDLHDQLYTYRLQLLNNHLFSLQDYENFIKSGDSARTLEERAAFTSLLMWQFAGDAKVLTLNQEIYRIAGSLEKTEFAIYMRTLQELDAVKRIGERAAIENMVHRGLNHIKQQEH